MSDDEEEPPETPNEELKRILDERDLTMNTSKTIMLVVVGLVAGITFTYITMGQILQQEQTMVEWQSKTLAEPSEGFQSYGVLIKLGDYETKNQAVELYNTRKTVCYKNKKGVNNSG